MENQQAIKFEVGKCYAHTNGHQMRILGEIETTIYGKCLLGETLEGGLLPIGMTEEHAVNFTEISQEEWVSNFIPVGAEQTEDVEVDIIEPATETVNQ